MNKTTLEIINHTIELEEKFLPKFEIGTAQHSLLNNRLQSLYTARKLIAMETVPAKEELEFALPRIESIMHKMSKARDKYAPGSRNYMRFDPTVQAMEKVRITILEALSNHDM